MTASSGPPSGRVRNHWYWRPGWRQGRRLYACHFTLDDQPQLRRLVHHYQDAVAGLPMLDLIPERWLHVTMQGIAFTDEVDPADLARVAGHLRQRLARFPAPTVTFRRATIGSEALILVAKPALPLYQLRLAMHDAVASVLPATTFNRTRPEPTEFTPHVSFAYVNRDAPAAPIADALRDTEPEPVTVTWRAASLLVFHRDHRMYEWVESAPVLLGPPEP